jgi:hypothetical protein
VTTKNDVIGAAQLLATRHITPQSFEQTLEDYVHHRLCDARDKCIPLVVFALIIYVGVLTFAAFSCR